MSPWSGTYGPNPKADSGQADRFTSAFNPAFSFVIDALLEHLDSDAGGEDGFGLNLSSAEFGAQSWVDPNAWAYFVAVGETEGLSIEEAAVHYTGLGGNHTLRAGRFFIDFGKQMQAHVHELRTIDRPLALRSFLGDEVKGDGVQWDCWTPVGDTAVVRWSFGVFGNLLPEADESGEIGASVAERKQVGELNATARLTGFADVGEHGILQLGTSARAIPDFTLAGSTADADVEAQGLKNVVYGLDATYGWTSDTGLVRWTFGGEALLDTGAVGGSADDAGTPGDPSDDTLRVIEEDLGGYYVFGDYAWDKQNSIGLQWSRADLPSAGTPDASELTAYYTRQFSEFHRLRFQIAALDEQDGDDSWRFGLQYTVFLGAHGHGVNW